MLNSQAGSNTELRADTQQATEILMHYLNVNCPAHGTLSCSKGNLGSDGVKAENFHRSVHTQLTTLEAFFF